MDLSKYTIKLLGHIGVDAGIIWIGDPCYIIHTEKNPKSIGKNWNEFCNILLDDTKSNNFKSFNFDLGHEGLGVCTSTYYGDGTYPVIGFFKENDGENTPVFVIIDFNNEFEDLLDD